MKKFLKVLKWILILLPLAIVSALAVYAHNNDIHADTMKEFAFSFSLPYIVLVIEIAIGVRYKKKYALKWKN